MKKIKLLYDATYIVEGLSSNNFYRSGIFWVAYNILKQFLKSSNYKVTLLIPSFSLSLKKYFLSHFNSPFNILLVKNINKYFKLNKFNIFITPIYYSPDIITKNASIMCYHILHDCIPSLHRDFYPYLDTNHWYSKLINNLNKETYYLCVSESTRNDFFRLFQPQLDQNKMYVTHISSSMNFFPFYDKEIFHKLLIKYRITNKSNINYVFSLCTVEPRKNLFFTISCFIKFIKNNNIDNLYFIHGGSNYDDHFFQLKEKLNALSEFQDRIIFLGYIDDEDLNVFYSNSLFFIYLSQYEGFGIPVLEAMQSGTPVICSNSSSFPEVVGDAAIKIPYNDNDLCIKAMEDLIFNENLRKMYISKGIERGKIFSWENTFFQMNTIIHNNFKSGT